MKSFVVCDSSEAVACSIEVGSDDMLNVRVEGYIPASFKFNENGKIEVELYRGIDDDIFEVTDSGVIICTEE